MKDRLAEIRARLDAKTTGAWLAIGDYEVPGKAAVESPDAPVPDRMIGERMAVRDADFIANAPADIAWLLAEVERQKAIIRRSALEDLIRMSEDLPGGYLGDLDA